MKIGQLPASDKASSPSAGQWTSTVRTREDIERRQEEESSSQLVVSCLAPGPGAAGLGAEEPSSSLQQQV